MKLKLKNALVKVIGFAKLEKYGCDKEDHLHWYSDLFIDLSKLDDKECEKIIHLIEPYQEIRGTKTAIRDIQTWLDLKNKKLVKVKRVRDFEGALSQYLKDVEGHRVFEKDSYDADALLCYRVTNVKYVEKEVHNYSTTPEHVVMKIIYKKFGINREVEIDFWGDDIRFKTIPEILGTKGFQVENTELRNQYLLDVKRFHDIKDQIGRQFIADGSGKDESLDDKDDERYYRKHRSGKAFSFQNNRILIDIFVEDPAKYAELQHSNRVDDGRWWWTTYGNKIDEDSREDDADEEEYGETVEQAEIPIHPHVVIFDLARHLRLVTHVNYLQEYIYDEKLADKLVLSKEVKDLIEILVRFKEGGFVDIVKGKSGGTVILLSGLAGVGKTLTAEVFAEYLKKPLYTVQASQLGLKPEELEDELKKVLGRAERWDAILLIDEADVYVHERGNDINQNAIVGVFLRVLEYHDTTLFLTTNRPDIVDDAIASRCIAKIDYKYPTSEQQKEIWGIISSTAKISIEKSVIDEFVEKHSQYSGRDIKNLIKLVNLKSLSDKKPIDVEMIEFIAKFNPTLLKNQENKN